MNIINEQKNQLQPIGKSQSKILKFFKITHTTVNIFERRKKQLKSELKKNNNLFFIKIWNFPNSNKDNNCNIYGMTRLVTIIVKDI